MYIIYNRNNIENNNLLNLYMIQNKILNIHNIYYMSGLCLNENDIKVYQHL